MKYPRNDSTNGINYYHVMEGKKQRTETCTSTSKGLLLIGPAEGSVWLVQFGFPSKMETKKILLHTSGQTRFPSEPRPEEDPLGSIPTLHGVHHVQARWRETKNSTQDNSEDRQDSTQDIMMCSRSCQ